MKSALVTGATGFIGSHLLPILSKQGWKMTTSVRHDFRQLPSIPIRTIKVGEIDGNTDWQEALEGSDTVIHLAARAHVLHETIPNPEAEFFRINTDGTANLVQQSIEAGVRHFVLISSIGAMASMSDQILTETSLCQPDSPYGRSKLQAERALMKLAQDSGMTWTIFRPPLVYGQGNPGNMERLMKLIRRGFPLPFGAIANRRSFVFVGNLVDAIATGLNHPNAAVNQIFLVSDDRDVSTPELIRLIAQQIEKPCKLLTVPPSLLKLLAYVGDGGQYLSRRTLPVNTYTLDRLLGSLSVDCNYLQKTLDWRPPFTLEQGLAQTLR